MEKTYIEKTKSKSKKLRARIDIELVSKDQRSFIFIENKFKSFPNKKQLDDYDKVFKSNFDKSHQLKKILFCFDKELVRFFNPDWEICDYSELLEFMKTEFDLKRNEDESIFIRHYFDFLNEYLENYKVYKTNCSRLFRKHPDNNEKFWLRLLNSQVGLSFSKKINNVDFEMVVNPGNTSTPVLDIIPLRWNAITGMKLLIQLQGDDLKFYTHSKDRNLIQNMIDFSSSRTWNGRTELKKLSKRESNSCFIFKIKVSDSLGDNFSLSDVADLVIDFYQNINNKIILDYQLSST